MPSFFETLGRIVSGQPAFNNADAAKSSHANTNTPSGSGGAKVIKKAEIVNVECFDGGAGMECWITVANDSADKLDLNQLQFLGRSTDLQTYVSPGERRRFRVYQGPHLSQPGSNHCSLEYIDSLGDYFIANHNVTFRQDNTGRYEVDDIDFLQVWDK